MSTLFIRSSLVLIPFFLFPAEILAAKVNERSRKILDYASDSEPDEDASNPTAWPTDDLYNSDCESIDSDLEDPLK